jgi:biopolymer transport protein ExbD
MRFKRRKIKRGRVEIIPMIDTIVILLVFYMTFSRFAEANKANVNLPTAHPTADDLDAKGKVVVNMHEDGSVEILKQRRTMAELTAYLQEQKQLLKDKDPNAKLGIVLRGSSRMRYRDLSEFMRACGKAQVRDVTFATIAPK